MSHIGLDDLCEHVDDFTQRISSHEDLEGSIERREPHASTYSCARPACVDVARRWVTQESGRDAVAVLLPALRQAAV